jgi:predicted small lipoprotein YifL
LTLKTLREIYMFKAIPLTAVLVLATVSLSACGHHDEAYYLSHPDAIGAKLLECGKKGPDAMQMDSECQAAVMAAMQNAMKQ